MQDNQKNEIFKTIQKFLKDPPVIIWGSGATIPYGLPSMDDLKQALQSKNLINLDQKSNLEVELGKIQKQDKINKIKACIRCEVLKKDIDCLRDSIKNPNYFDAIDKMIEVFYQQPHPQKIDIVTTNYDRVLEYAISKLNYEYTDGFSGRQLSKLDKDNFKSKKQINLMKVHGSLNWVKYENNNPFFLSDEHKMNNLQYLMILPSKKKYQDAFEEPYRTIITKSDEVIEKAKSFLVIGFGFNDKHITPKLENKIKNDKTPIVIITEKATDSCKQQLEKTEKYCLLERSKNNETKLMSSEKSLNKINLKGSYWKLENFMEIFK